MNKQKTKPKLNKNKHLPISHLFYLVLRLPFQSFLDPNTGSFLKQTGGGMGGIWGVQCFSNILSPLLGGQ